MAKGTTYVGMDTHKKDIVAAILFPRRKETKEVRLPNNSKYIKKFVKQLKKKAPGEVACCYEAGPCGYVLQRQLQHEGFECAVIAPSLIPSKPGDRIKTDRRDAKKLVELFKAGLLTEVRPPTEAEEAVRDLCRCREDARLDLTRHRHQLGKFLLRRDLVFTGTRSNWTQKHHEWLRQLEFDDRAEQDVSDDYLITVERATERLRSLDVRIEEISKGTLYGEAVARLRCFRGIDTTAAMTIVSELHDFRRFSTPRQLMSFVGLVPSEYSTGESKRKGGITKTGNCHVRRMLTESSWAYSRRPAIGPGLRKRRQGQPGWVVAIADKAQSRLYRRYWKLVTKGKHKNKALTAVARELVGFIWAVLRREG